MKPRNGVMAKHTAPFAHATKADLARHFYESQVRLTLKSISRSYSVCHTDYGSVCMHKAL